MKNRFVVSILSLSAAGLLSIAGYEGFKDTAYIPISGDIPTIGFGHADKRIPLATRISVTDALGLLNKDTKQAQDAIKRCVHVPLSQNEYDAYTSLAFNIGSGAFCSSTLVKKLNQSDYVGACNEIQRWHYFRGRSLDGLVKRRQAEFELCVRE